METNALPEYDLSDNPTNCCPRFDPEGWDEQELSFQDKLFVKAQTRSLFHIPVNIGSVFRGTFADILAAEAHSDENLIVLSHDPSPWRAEHFFAVTKEVPGRKSVKLSGQYLTRVFEGPYREMPAWCRETEAYVKEKGKRLEKLYYFYTTCPKCAKAYGRNYVVAVAEVG